MEEEMASNLEIGNRETAGSICDIEDVLYGRTLYGESTQYKAKTVSRKLNELTSSLLEDTWKHNQDDKAVDAFSEHDIFNQVFNWITQSKELMKEMTPELMTIYNNILSIGSDCFIRKKAFIEPLMLLLLALRPNEKKRMPFELEYQYIQLLNNLCLRLVDGHFLEKFDVSTLSKQGYKIPRYGFINLLMSYIHEDNELGSCARDSLIICLQVSALNRSFGKYIAFESDCCNILAAGLSGLYSALPTALDVTNDDWYCINTDMVASSPELQGFVKAVRYCCEVVHFGHPLVGERLLALIHSGFLSSVFASALHQTITEAVIAATSYLELFIRAITEERFMKILLKFLLADEHDGTLIVDIITRRIKSQVPQLKMVTLQFFKTLMDLNCEDVVYHLIIRYLIPCNHILPNQKRIIKELDFYCKSATMFLYLTPSCCVESQFNLNQHEGQQCEHVNDAAAVSSDIESVSPSQPVRKLLQSSFMECLYNARVRVRGCKDACKCWCAVYDGMDVMTDMPTKSGSSILICHSRSDRSSSDVFSFAARRNSSLSESEPRRPSREHEELRDMSGKTRPVFNGYAKYDTEGVESQFYLGPFMTLLYEELECMMENSYYVNLQLTSLISRLACYPQPLLRSLLLNSNLVMQPGVKSLFQILTTLSQSADVFLAEIDDFRTLITRARQNLTKRERKYFGLSPEIRRKDSIMSSLSVDFRDSGPSDDQAVDPNGKIPNALHTVQLNEPQISIQTDGLYAEAALAARSSTGARIGRLHPAMRSPQKRVVEPISRPDAAYSRRKNPVAIKNAIYCAILLEEWLKELAAISLEHNLV